MGNYGYPDYSKSGGFRDLLEIRRVESITSSFAKTLMTVSGKTSGPITGDTLLVVVNGQEFESTTVSSLSSILGGGGGGGGSGNNYFPGGW